MIHSANVLYLYSLKITMKKISIYFFFHFLLEKYNLFLFYFIFDVKYDPGISWQITVWRVSKSNTLYLKKTSLILSMSKNNSALTITTKGNIYFWISAKLILASVFKTRT